MKKYLLSFILIFIGTIFFSNNIFSYSILKDNNNDIYYLKTCTSQYLCIYQCKEGTDTNKLTHQNINQFCNTVKNSNTTSGLSIIDNIDEILPSIVNVNTIEIVPITKQENFKNFLKDLSELKTDKYDKKCIAEKCNSNVEVMLNTWKKIKDSDNIIYQFYSNHPLATLQWTRPLPLKTDGSNRLKLNYEEAKKICENYDFRGKGWKLPSSSDLQEAIKYELGEEFNETIDGINITDESFAWSVDIDEKPRAKQLIVPWSPRTQEKNFRSKDGDNKKEHYVICSRKYSYE